MSTVSKDEENAAAIVYEVLGHRALDVDTTTIEYIINVLKDESFDFGVKGKGAYQKSVDLLVDSRCVDDEPEACLVCGKLSEKIGSHEQTGKKEIVRSLTTPVQMYDGLCQEESPPKKAKIEDGPPMSKCDRAELERRRRKDERQRKLAYESHLEEMKASLAGMPIAHVHHGNGDEGSTVKDGSIALSYGRHYGLIGRKGYGGFDDDRRQGRQSRGGGDRDMPYRADKADNWGNAKKSLPPMSSSGSSFEQRRYDGDRFEGGSKGFDGSSRGFDGGSRADEADNWGSGKTFVPNAPSDWKSMGLGSSYNPTSDSDRWGAGARLKNQTEMMIVLLNNLGSF